MQTKAGRKSFRLSFYEDLFRADPDFLESRSWQAPAIAQWAQLQPQEDFPFRLSATSLQTIPATINASTRQMPIVPIFSPIQASIHSLLSPALDNHYLLVLTNRL